MAEEKMVKVAELRTAVAQRLPGGRRGKFYGPGKNIEIPASLARSLGLTPVKQDEARVLALAGSTEEDRKAAAAREGKRGEAKAPPARKRIDDQGRTKGIKAPDGTEVVGAKAGKDAKADKATGASDYSKWSNDDLKAEADALGVEVTREEGKSGDPVKADYVRALEAHRAQQ